MIEPIHIVILGIAITAVGAAWQWRRASPDPQIAALQSQVNELKQKLVSPPKVEVQPDKASEQPALSPREAQKLTEALEDIERWGEATIWPAINNINQWAVNWRGVIRNHNGIQLYTTLRETLKTEVWERIDVLLSKYSKYDAVLQDALALGDPSAKNDLAQSLQECIDAIGKLPKDFPPSMDDLLEPQFKNLIKQSGLAYQWEIEARRRIREMVENLKKKGVAEYAKK